MKKILILLLAVMVLVSSVSLAENPASLFSAELRDFRSAVDAAGEFVSVSGDIDYLAAAMEKDGKYLRVVTILDDHAKELYMTAMDTEDNGETFDAFQAYAWSLPVSYTEEITQEPKDQAELDAQAGRTVGQLVAEGYYIYGSGGGIGLPTVIDLSFGLFNYEFEVEATFEEYQKYQERDDLESMILKSGKFSGFSSFATDPDYLADGTCKPYVVPNITAEEASAANDVPPPEEYTAKAWALSAEGYADLLNNLEERYGQVYMVEGIVHQILSKDPMRVIINTGEGGKTQPVVVECPENRSFTWEAGSRWRIYADVSSACCALPVLTARYSYSFRTESPEDTSSGTENGFIAPGIVPAKGIEDFIGEWQYYRIINEDGSAISRDNLLADGLADDHAEYIITEDEVMLYAASLGDVGSVTYKFNPEDGSLVFQNGSYDPPVMRLTDNGMLYIYIPTGSSSGGIAAYLVRKQP